VGNSKPYSEKLQVSGRRSGLGLIVPWKIGVTLVFSLAALALPAREDNAISYGMGLIVNVPFPESEVAQVVEEVIHNGIIRGTKEYNKDEYITGATAASSTRVFPEWTEGDKIFYKVRLKAVNPRNFKNSSDLGTLAVRYVVQAQDNKNTVLRIDARFVEDFRHIAHASNGSVESAEYKDIHDHLDSIESMKAQTVEVEKDKQEQSANKQGAALSNLNLDLNATPATYPQSSSVQSSPVQSSPVNVARDDASPNASASSSPQTLEQHVQDLRRQVQRLVKAPGAPLKSAPFHTASTLQSLSAGTEVLIVVSTTYWFGVETHEGQHGWILRDELEQLP
jgi:hypothetical protein